MGKKRSGGEHGDGDDDDNFQGFDLDDFYTTGVQGIGKDNKGAKPGDKKDGKGEKGGAEDKDAKQKKKDLKNKSQDVAALMMGTQK